MAFDCAQDETLEVLYDPSSPEPDTMWWADRAAVSVLRYGLMHADGLER